MTTQSSMSTSSDLCTITAPSINNQQCIRKLLEGNKTKQLNTQNNLKKCNSDEGEKIRERRIVDLVCLAMKEDRAPSLRKRFRNHEALALLIRFSFRYVGCQYVNSSIVPAKLLSDFTLLMKKRATGYSKYYFGGHHLYGTLLPQLSNRRKHRKL
jgi:hypothetical protein